MNVDGMPNINASVDAILSAIDNTVPLVQEFLKDTSFPLEDRWALYLKIEKLLPIESYFGEAIRELTDDIYEEFFPDGKGIRWNSDIDVGLHENNPDMWENHSEPETDEWVINGRAMWAKRDAWREAVLKEGRGLVVFDW